MSGLQHCFSKAFLEEPDANLSMPVIYQCQHTACEDSVIVSADVAGTQQWWQVIAQKPVRRVIHSTKGVTQRHWSLTAVHPVTKHITCEHQLSDAMSDLVKGH